MNELICCHICGEEIPPGADAFLIKDRETCQRCYYRTKQREEDARALVPKATERFDPPSEVGYCHVCGEPVPQRADLFLFQDRKTCGRCYYRLQEQAASVAKATKPVRAKSGVMDGVRLGCGGCIVLPLLIVGGFVVLVALVGTCASI